MFEMFEMFEGFEGFEGFKMFENDPVPERSRRVEGLKQIV